MEEIAQKIHDNGAATPKGDAAGGNDATELAKALEHEKRRNATLVSLLRKTRNKADSFNWVEEPSIEEDLPQQVARNSTMRESFPGNESSIMTSMALASLNISECKPRDGKEIDKQTFERWKQTLQAALQISGVEDERAKANAFTIKAGEQLKDLLEATSSSRDAPDETLYPYSNMMYRLEQHFGSQDYLLLQRQKLRSLLQETGEEDSKYVRRVVAAAKLCGYGDVSLFENVVDVLQAHALSLDVRKACRKLLRMKEAPKRKLELLLEEVDALEVDQKHEAIFARNHPPLKVSAEVSAVRFGHPLPGSNPHYSRGGFTSRPSYSPRPSHGYQGQSYSPRPSYGHHGGYYGQRGSHSSWARGRGKFNGRGKPFQPNTERAPRCWRCTGTFHRPELCDSIDKICHKCHEKGHIARACDEVPEEHRSKRQLTPEGKFPQPSKLRKVAALAEDNDNQPGLESIRQAVRAEYSSKEIAPSIQSVGPVCGPSESRGCGTVTGYVAGVAVVFLIDSGAGVNTVDKKNFDKMLVNNKSKQGLYCYTEGTDLSLKAYASPGFITVIGSFTAELFITADRPSFFEKFYIVHNARPLLSRGTALRYSVLQLGLQVQVQKENAIQEVFALSKTNEFPKFNIPPVVISYDQSMPPSRHVFTNIPPAFKEETERRLAELLMSGIIEKVTTRMDRSFCSSLLVVPKGKDDIRLVVDLRGPNKCIIRTPFRMPTLESILARLNGAKWFSTIDLTSAFFHVVLDERSRHLTNFFAGQDMYRFVRLPFGLTNAPDVFQEALQTNVLEGCEGTCNYLDDILVYGKTLAEHDSNLRTVLSRLRIHGVRLNEQKCVFRKNSVKFLGFQLSYDGLSVEEDKLKALENFRRPETLQEVKSFLGLINFSERFILKRADKTENLRNLSRSETFYWTDSEEEEFLYLKYEALSSIKKLGYFDCNDNTELFVDASPIGLGAVLVQYNNEGTPRIIACASKALSASEQKYPQSQKEALSIVWGVERFSYYLTSKPFVVRTDSESNEIIFNSELRTGKRAVTRAETWALRLQSYRFKPKRVPGNQNIADALSRLIDRSQIDEPFDDVNEKHVLYALDAAHMNLSWNTIEIASETDAEMCAVKSALRTGVWPANLRRYETQSKELRVLGSLIFKSDKIILPLELRRTAIEIAHQGHVGCGSTKKLLRDYFWWPNMSKEAVEFVGKCEACLLVSRKNPPLPLCSRALPQGPWEILQIDFLTLNGCGSGHFLVVVDMYSRFLQVIEMKTTDCKKTNAALCKAFTTWGLPLIIQSDNGPPFQSQEFTEYWEDKGVRVRKSIPLSAQSNGGVERQNQGIIKSVSAAKAEQRNWREALQDYVHVHNTRKEHSRLGVTPFELLVGWKYRGTFPALWEAKSSEKVDKEQVIEDDAASKLFSKKFADNSRGAKESNIRLGDRVVISITQRNKLDPSFSRERYTVLARKGAKVVVRSDCGVQLARNVQDVKRAQEFSVDSESVVAGADDTLANVPLNARDHNSEKEQQENRQSPADNNSSVVGVNFDGSEAVHVPVTSGDGLPTNIIGRPKRDIQKPSKYNDMYLYNIFQ